MWEGGKEEGGRNRQVDSVQSVRDHIFFEFLD